MSEGLRTFLNVLKAISLNLGIAALVTFIFYKLKNKDLFGGYIGGMIIGVIGSLIGAFLLDGALQIVIEFLQNKSGVNLIAAFIGAFIPLTIMNKLNHDKERVKY